MTLTRFESQDGIEIFIDTQTGESFASQSGYARMSVKTRQAINKRCQGCNQKGLVYLEIPTGSGVQGCNLITEDLIVEWLPKDNPEMATKLMKLGVRMFLHTVAGYEVTSEAVQKETKSPDLEILQIAGKALESANTDELTKAKVLIELAIENSLMPSILVQSVELLLSATMPTPKNLGSEEAQKEELVTVTTIANDINLELDLKGKNAVKARDINMFLIEMGIQYLNPEYLDEHSGVVKYIPTSEGTKFTKAGVDGQGFMYRNRQIGDQKVKLTIPYTRWFQQPLQQKIIQFLECRS